MLNVVALLMAVAGVLYQRKYLVQRAKIIRLQTSKGVSKEYFLISIIYEAFILTLTIWLFFLSGLTNVSTWALFILTILPLGGNVIVFLPAVKYAPISYKKSFKHKIYRKVRSWLK
jgi:hypothetical protein